MGCTGTRTLAVCSCSQLQHRPGAYCCHHNNNAAAVQSVPAGLHGGGGGVTHGLQTVQVALQETRHGSSQHSISDNCTQAKLPVLR